MSGETLRYSTSSPVVTTTATDNPLTTLIRRLEAATSRLEDIASSANSFQEPPDGEVPPANGVQLSSSAPELPTTGGFVGGGAGRGMSTGTVRHVQAKEGVPERIEEMDELIGKEVKAFVDASVSLDDLVQEQVSSVNRFAQPEGEG